MQQMEHQLFLAAENQLILIKDSGKKEYSGTIKQSEEHYPVLLQAC